MKMLYSYKLKSHPNKLLVKHLENVAWLCKRKVERANIKFNYPKDVLAQIAYIIGATHDIGKGTEYFQEYLCDIIKGKAIDRNDELKEHGFLSAIMTFGLVNRYINCIEGEDRNLSYLPYIAFFIVKRHHGNLTNLNYELRFTPYERKHRKQIITNQIEAMEPEEILSIIYRVLNIKLTSEGFREIYEDSFEKVTFDGIIDEELMEEMVENKNLEYYFVEKFLFSVLVSSDKNEVILERQFIEPDSLQSNLIDEFLKNDSNKKESPLNAIRQQAYTEVTEKAHTLDLNDKIFSISLPTGLGKTFTSISLALKLMERLRKDEEDKFRLIYCLPFTSIIDQNYSVMENVLKEVEGVLPPTKKLLKHHYLSDVYYKDSNRRYDIDESQHLINTWESSIIITTFVQFFYTIFSNKNKALMKFNSMANSVIILDEIQAIPYKYWLLLNQILPYIAEKLNIYFVLVTATQPLIFRETHDEVIELVDRRDYYFSLFNRTRLHIRIGEVIFIEDFCEEMAELIKHNPNKNILIVLNTIKSSRQVFNYLCDLDLENTEFIYLSTVIIPKERQKRIEKIMEYTDARKIVVSTQLIEAGVDIDMDIVVRDMGPWDSIIQVAGRANRNDKGKDGDVYIYALANEQKEFYRYIYKQDSLTIDKTFEILEGISNIAEKDYGILTQKYFSKIHYDGDASANTSMDLLEGICNMDFEKVSDEFKLIDNLANKIDVFIEIDSEAEKVWNQFQQIKSIDNIFDRRKEFLKIKKDFYQYVISVDSKDVEIDSTGWIGYVSRYQLKNTYNLKTGYEQVYESTII